MQKISVHLLFDPQTMRPELAPTAPPMGTVPDKEFEVFEPPAVRGVDDASKAAAASQELAEIFRENYEEGENYAELLNNPKRIFFGRILVAVTQEFPDAIVIDAVRLAIHRAREYYVKRLTTGLIVRGRRQPVGKYLWTGNSLGGDLLRIMRDADLMKGLEAKL